MSKRERVLYQIREIRDDERTHYRQGEPFYQIWTRRDETREWQNTHHETATYQQAVGMIDMWDDAAAKPEFKGDASHGFPNGSAAAVQREWEAEVAGDFVTLLGFEGYERMRDRL